MQNYTGSPNSEIHLNGHSGAYSTQYTPLPKQNQHTTDNYFMLLRELTQRVTKNMEQLSAEQKANYNKLTRNSEGFYTKEQLEFIRNEFGRNLYNAANQINAI